MFFVPEIERHFMKGEIVHGLMSIYDQDENYIGEIRIEWNSRADTFKIGLNERRLGDGTISRTDAKRVIEMFLEVLRYARP